MLNILYEHNSIAKGRRIQNGLTNSNISQYSLMHCHSTKQFQKLQLSMTQERDKKVSGGNFPTQSIFHTSSESPCQINITKKEERRAMLFFSPPLISPCAISVSLWEEMAPLHQHQWRGPPQ